MSNTRDSIAEHYHERTKYHPETIANKNKALDWENQPLPYKTYKIGTSFDLKPYLERSPEGGDPSHERWRRLSRLFYHSYGVTAKLKTIFGTPAYLRAAPSAGGLYPAELYLISRGTSILPPGLYNYHCPTHSLVHFWESDAWPDLQAACFWHPALENTQLALVVTAVFYRSAWRYEDRAYRRIFLDTGHLLGNIELAGSLVDYRPHLIGGFLDREVDELLYLDPEQEGTIAAIPLADLLEIEQNLSPATTALPSDRHVDYPKIPDGRLLEYLHRQTRIATEPPSPAPETDRAGDREDKYNFPFCSKVPMDAEAIAWGEDLEGLEKTIVKRRSTRGYNGEDIGLEPLKSLLHFTYQPQDYLDQGLDPDPDYFDLNLISTFVAVSGVTGLEAGCYYYAPRARELRQIRFKNFRQELQFLCLGQDLGRDAAAIVFQTADLRQAVSLYGERVYRYLHMDAGHLGQRLNLAAIYLGLGASGIAGFFDDQVNEVLGIPEDEAVLYLTTLGRPRTPGRF